MGEARLLRVLSGPHLGAEMSLSPGRYAIGTDENCDIVLTDSRLAARHAFLIVSDDQVSIEPGDGAVTVDGAQVDGRVVVADFKPVLMGVQGYLKTEAQRRELISALQPMLGRVDLRVWSSALLEESIGQVLAGMRLQLTVSEVEDGKVTLTGVLPPSISKERLEQTLQRDVPGIASIDLQVVSIAEATHWLRDQIAGIGIPEKTLSIDRQGDSLVIDGPAGDQPAGRVARSGERVRAALRGPSSAWLTM